MSDGPYRSLNLRHQWKQLLKRAYELAFDSQDVIDAICPALERDWSWEITKDFLPTLRAFCAKEEPSLFDDRTARLEQLKHLAAGRGTLGAVLADCAAEALGEGKSGEAAVLQAIHQSLMDRLVRNGRQMEEHVLREVGSRKASEVRSRLTSAITQAAVQALAQKLASQAASPSAAPPKHSGLDDGVGLR